MTVGLAALVDPRHTAYVIEPTLSTNREMVHDAVNGRARPDVLSPLDDLTDVFSVWNLDVLRYQSLHNCSVSPPTTAVGLSEAGTTSMSTEVI